MYSNDPGVTSPNYTAPVLGYTPHLNPIAKDGVVTFIGKYIDGGASGRPDIGAQIMMPLELSDDHTACFRIISAIEQKVSAGETLVIVNYLADWPRSLDQNE